jgi:hypothetical protein
MRAASPLKSMTRVALIAAIVSVTLTLSAQFPEPPPLERLLIPSFPEDHAGRFGSVWTSELIVTNTSARNIIYSSGGPWCTITTPLPGTCEGGFARLAPGIHRFPGGIKTGGPIGVLRILEKEYADEVHFFLRVWDRSRETEDWGTNIPVVRERDFLRAPVYLSGAPTSDEFRVNLRVYEPKPTNRASVRVTLFPLEGLDHNHHSPLPDDEAASVVLLLHGGSPPELDPDWPSIPAGAQINDLVAMFPHLRGADRFSVRIEPLDDTLRYWAMLTITHNETQHVTIIAP